MCYFITIGFRDSFKDYVLTSYPKNLNLSPSHNPSILKSLPNKHLAYNLITAMCSCDLFTDNSLEKERLKRKYMKKGWSSGKINRALSNFDCNSGLRRDVRDWIGELVKHIGNLVLLVHWYTAEVNLDNFEIDKNQKIFVDDFVNGSIKIEEDTLYIIVS